METDDTVQNTALVFRYCHDRLYICHGDGGRILLPIADVIDIEKSSLSAYVQAVQQS